MAFAVEIVPERDPSMMAAMWVDIMPSPSAAPVGATAVVADAGDIVEQ
jgi:hypothetical protein